MSKPVRRGSLAVIAAVGRGGLIGAKEGRLGLPWHLPEDLRRFRLLTTGHAIIMGRVTHELIGRALPKRRNIVLSRVRRSNVPGVEWARSLDEALEMAEADSLPFVIGGAQVYAEALPRCTRVYLTEVDRDAQGEVHFPAFDRAAFREVAREPAAAEGVVFVTLERVR